MAGSIIKQFKEMRIAEYLSLGLPEEAGRIASGDLYSPIMKAPDLHQEQEGENGIINNTFKDILNDLAVLEQELYLSASDYNDLVSDTLNRMDNIQREADIAREKIMDMNMLCGEDSPFSKVRTLTNDDFVEDPIVNDLITLEAKVSNKVKLSVVDVTGNGMEGNYFVYVDGEFLSDTVPTDDRASMVDDKIGTFYEYQRLRTSKDTGVYFTGVNKDAIDVQFTVTIKADEPITSVKVETTNSNLTLTDLMVSESGVDYNRVIEDDIDLFMKEFKYNKEAQGYIHESGVIAFPAASFVRLTFSTPDITRDSIAFEYTEQGGA